MRPPKDLRSVYPQTPKRRRIGDGEKRWIRISLKDIVEEDSREIPVIPEREKSSFPTLAEIYFTTK